MKCVFISLYYKEAQIINAIKLIKKNKEKRTDALLDIVLLFFNGLEFLIIGYLVN